MSLYRSKESQPMSEGTGNAEWRGIQHAIISAYEEVLIHRGPGEVHSGNPLHNLTGLPEDLVSERVLGPTSWRGSDYSKWQARQFIKGALRGGIFETQGSEVPNLYTIEIPITSLQDPNGPLIMHRIITPAQAEAIIDSSLGVLQLSREWFGQELRSASSHLTQGGQDFVLKSAIPLLAGKFRK